MTPVRLVAAALISLLALGAVAVAATRNTPLRGSVVNEPDAKVVVIFSRNGGEPSAVDRFKIRDLDYSCFGSAETGEFKTTLEREARWELIKGVDSNGKKVWTFFNRKDTFRDDKFGVFAIFLSVSTNRKARKAEGTVGISFGDGCTNDKTDGFDGFSARRP